MRVEINVNEQEKNTSTGEDQLQESAMQTQSSDVAIDIGQVLAANQALLKNMARRMESMEKKLHSMESAFNEQARLIVAERESVLLLTGPVKEVKPWEPPVRERDEEHYQKFSLFDRVFRPWLMRRQ